LSPYRDSVGALRARLGEVERAIVEKRARRPASARETKWRLAALLLLGTALALFATSLRGLYLQHVELRRYQAQLSRPPLPATAATPQRWRAHIFTSDVARLADGAECTVAIDAPCTAWISCGGFAYRGHGTCADGGFVDRADSELDGTAECEIDARAGRVLLRELTADPSGGFRRRWYAELELVRE
jgi:hypothetical protein